jgi:biopolymer transport protein ExbD
MHSALASFKLTSLTLLGSLALGGACGGEDKPEAAAPSAPIVGSLEMPVSLRASDAQPADAHTVEISPTALNVNGQPVLTLAGGMASDADLPKLQSALASPARPRMKLSVSAQVPYGTVVQVLSAAKAAGLRGVAFEVRAPGATTNTGILAIDDFNVRPRSKLDEEVAIAGVAARPWGDFTSKWEEVEGACRSSTTGNCAYKPEKIADGGNLKITLTAAGQGVNVGFSRVGAPPPEEPTKAKAELIDGIKAPVDPVADVEQAAPATEAAFQFRAQEAVTAPSAVSGVLKPVCGTSACGVVVSSEKTTLFVRVASLLGAAFPDGSPAPAVVFEAP